MEIIEQILTVYLIFVMLALTVVAVVVAIAFFINLYKQIKLLRRERNESMFNKLEW